MPYLPTSESGTLETRRFTTALAYTCMDFAVGMPRTQRHITMDFAVGMPRTQRHRDAIWVVVDRLTKSAHFLPMRITFSAEQLAELYIKEIVRLHRVPLSIVSDRNTKFAS